MRINKQGLLVTHPNYTQNSFTYQSWVEFSFSSHFPLCGNKISFLFIQLCHFSFCHFCSNKAQLFFLFQFETSSSLLFVFIYLFVYLFIYLWLHWVFIAVRGFLIAVASLVVEHGLQACGLQYLWAQYLWHAGSVFVARRLQSTGSVVVAHGLSCSAACGIFPDQDSNPCPLYWQADS